MVMEPIFAALERNSHRWRRFAVVMYGTPTQADFRTFDMLWGEYDAEEPDSHDNTMPRGKTFLPDISVLISVLLDINVPQVIHHWPVPRAHDMQLQKLTYIQLVITNDTWDVLLPVCTNTKRLQLVADFLDPPSEPLNLVCPNLELLWMNEAVCEALVCISREFTTSALRELVITNGQFRVLKGWLSRISIHLRHLELRGLSGFDEQDADALISLERLEVIQFRQSMAVPPGLLNLMGQSGSLPLAGAENGRHIVWPQLRRFELYSSYFTGPRRTLRSQLDRVVRMRARDGPLDEYGLPRWVKLRFGFFGECRVREHLLRMIRESGAEVRVE